MNKTAIAALVLAFVGVSCHPNKKVIYGCDSDTSHKIFVGDFNSTDIVSIGIFKSSQKTFYPIPNWKENVSTIWITDQIQIASFKDTLSQVSSVKKRPELREGWSGSLHLIVNQKDGTSGCLFGRPISSGFFIGPMFERDSYGSIRNDFYNFIVTYL
jgi:hypothetical protein